MSKRPKCIKIILPTAELMEKFAVNQGLLDKIQVSFEGIGTFIMQRWAKIESNWGMYVQDGRHQSAFELIYTDIQHDYLDHDYREVLDKDDIVHLRTLLHSFTKKFYREIIGLLDQFHLTEYQLETLVVEPWLDNSMVICIYRT